MSSTPPGLTQNALDAAGRLAQSREQLRLALHDPGAASARQRAAAGRPAGGWLAQLAALPGAGVLLEGLRLWWSRHPWRVYGLLAVDAGNVLVKPLARQHPVALVLGAGLVGAALGWLRPWRWVVRSGAVAALLAGLLPQLLSHGLHAKTHRAAAPTRPSGPDDQPAARDPADWRGAASSPL